MIGRAGRSQQHSTSLLLFNSAELRNCSQPLKALCEAKENCHRHALLHALSVDERSTVVPNMCCNLCTVSCPYKELEFPSLSHKTTRKPRIRPVLPHMQSYLRTKLLEERDKFIERNKAFRMVPKSVVCPLSVITDIANRSSSIHSAQDMHTFAGLRQQLHIPFFNVLQSVHT